VLASAAHAAAPPVPGFASFTAIGDVSNYTNPDVWEHHSVDVTAWVAGASNAQLSFDFANDPVAPGAPSTHAATDAHLYFASDSGSYFLNFKFFRPLDEPFANASSHLQHPRPDRLRSPHPHAHARGARARDLGTDAGRSRWLGRADASTRGGAMLST